MAPTVKFFQENCLTKDYKYTQYNGESLCQDRQLNCKICEILYKQINAIPDLETRTTNKLLKRYQIAQFNKNLVLLDSKPNMDSCDFDQFELCDQCDDNLQEPLLEVPACKNKDKQQTLISNELLGKLAIYANLGL